MNSFLKGALLAGAAWSTLTAAAWAQDTTPVDATDVGEIVVTARRTEENLQAVPAAVSAFNERALERLQAVDTTGLQGAVPNLNIVQGRGSSNSTNIYIRGVGQPDALQTFDPAVGVYIDDVYLSRIRGSQIDLLDLERVEVLRGPQGTLYGKNTIGGALKFVSRKPGQDPRGAFAVGYGDYNALELKGSVSGPLSDTLAASFAALKSKRDGFVTDPVTGAEYNDKNTTAVRGQLAWTPTDRFRADISADWSQDDAAMTVGQATNSLYTFSNPVVPIYAVPVPAPEYDFKTRTTPGLPNSTKLSAWGVSANLSYELSDALTLRSITAYRTLETDDYIDFDATELEIADAFVGVSQNQVSQEFQLTYDNGGPLTAVGGVYYLKEEVGSHQESYNDDLLGPLYLNSTFLRTIDDELTTTSWAAYVNGSYAITERLNVSLGLRYTKEEKDYDRTTSTFYGSLPAFNLTYAFAPPTGEWEDVSPMISVDYQLTDDAMVYARVSKGFKSGGFNGRANSALEATKYDPETVVAYEAGAKTTWFDKRLRANATVFYSDYEDFQARVSGLDTDPITNLPAPVLGVINAGKLKIQGAELELQANPIRGLLLETQIGYLDAEYEDFDDVRFPAFGGSRAFQTPAFSPEWTARYAGQYEFDMGARGFLTVGASARFRSEMALAIDNTPVNSDVRLPGMWQGDYWLYDARIVWETADRNLSLGLYGQNLGDEVYKTDAQEFSSIGNIRTAYYGAPQTWMARLGLKF